MDKKGQLKFVKQTIAFLSGCRLAALSLERSGGNERLQAVLDSRKEDGKIMLERGERAYIVRKPQPEFTAALEDLRTFLNS